jgi:hypothetical protein
MEIKQEVKDKIYNFVHKKNIGEISEPMPNKGVVITEIKYELASNPSIPKYLFVVSEKYTFYNGSIQDKRWGVYAFDKETGDLVPDFEEKEGCQYGFFNELDFIERII